MTNPRLIGLSVCLFALAGCGTPAPPSLHPVTGTVTLGGKPATAGGLIFIPESGTWGGMVVNGSVNPDGTLLVTTSRTVNGQTVLMTGAPAGRFKVHYHPPSDGQAIGLETELPDVVVIEPRENVLTLDVPPNRSVRELRKQAESKGDQPTPTTEKK